MLSVEYPCQSSESYLQFSKKPPSASNHSGVPAEQQGCVSASFNSLLLNFDARTQDSNARKVLVGRASDFVPLSTSQGLTRLASLRTLRQSKIITGIKYKVANTVERVGAYPYWLPLLAKRRKTARLNDLAQAGWHVNPSSPGQNGQPQTSAQQPIEKPAASIPTRKYEASITQPTRFMQPLRHVVLGMIRYSLPSLGKAPDALMGTFSFVIASLPRPETAVIADLPGEWLGISAASRSHEPLSRPSEPRHQL
ncbi:hypothetical protein LZ30DRAFT_775673 [Colletotrichum cereale]|nr:hypothetical protein LZ30DRAFT_775673 [Colletotrichum cereale]